VKLPIDVIPDTDPPRFRWTQRVDTLNGPVDQECEGQLPVTVERAVADLIALVKKLEHDKSLLLAELHRRSTAQKREELNSVNPQMSSSRKGKG
jgi:hypothetical protein